MDRCGRRTRAATSRSRRAPTTFRISSKTRSTKTRTLKAVKTAFFSTLIALLIGYPMAYGIARAKQPWRNTLLMLVVLPFWTSFLIRVYAWKVILQGNGPLNAMLMWLGVVDEPVQILYTDFAIYLGIVYSYLPFMVLPLYAAHRTTGSDVERSGGRSRRAAVARIRCRSRCRCRCPASSPAVGSCSFRRSANS